MQQRIEVARGLGGVSYELTFGDEPDYASVWLNEEELDALRDMLLRERPIVCLPEEIRLFSSETNPVHARLENVMISESTFEVRVRDTAVLRSTRTIRRPATRFPIIGFSGLPTLDPAAAPVPVETPSEDGDPFGLWTRPTILEVLSAMDDGSARTTGDVARAIRLDPESRDWRGCLLCILGSLVRRGLATQSGMLGEPGEARGSGTVWRITDAGRGERIRLRALAG